jgi:hypothetical protein
MKEKLHTVNAKYETSIEYLKSILSYDPDTGYLSWKVKRSSARIGEPIGLEAKTPYIQIGIDYKVYLAHRLAFALYHGYWPTEVDHINGNTRDNRIKNLREVSRSHNTLNRKKPTSRNTSGHTGVTFVKKWSRWQAKIQFKGKEIARLHRTKEGAVAIRRELVKQFYGEEFCRDC